MQLGSSSVANSESTLAMRAALQEIEVELQCQVSLHRICTRSHGPWWTLQQFGWTLQRFAAQRCTGMSDCIERRSSGDGVRWAWRVPLGC